MTEILSGIWKDKILEDMIFVMIENVKLKMHFENVCSWGISSKRRELNGDKNP